MRLVKWVVAWALLALALVNLAEGWWWGSWRQDWDRGTYETVLGCLCLAAGLALLRDEVRR